MWFIKADERRRADGERGEEGGEEGKFIVSVFAVANKRKRLQFAEPVYSFCQREREWEQETDCESERTGVMEELKERESETARLLLFCVTFAADVPCSGRIR